MRLLRSSPEDDKRIEDFAESRRGSVVIALLTVITGVALAVHLVVGVLR
ncbi:MAG: hypothetical protein Q4C85_07160 [Actinomyces sp.]|nr:hypothetical protein [Actinomyces sp.]MDO4243521.1 hypothetical protein [Actinomyces sp.]